jgi:hypothetical protein
MADLRPSVVLVGESPPLNAPPDFKPFDCASGTNLCRYLGLAGRAVLLEHVPRDNIFHTPGVGIKDGPKWDYDEARKSGARILMHRPIGSSVIALGDDPGKALGVGDLPWYAWRRDPETGVHVVTAPHPSGRSSIVGHNREAAATFRRALLPDILAGCPTLRSWHFTLSLGEVVADIGAALCPYDPAVGVIAAVLAQEAQAMPAIMAPDMLRAVESLTLLDIIRALAAPIGGDSKTRTDLLRNLFKIRRGTDLVARVKSAAKTVVADYPAEVLRATIGRYAALGVL